MIRPAENIPLTKWYGSEGKFCYKMIPFVGKMSPQRGHGSTHPITEIGTGIHLTNSSCHSYLWRLGNQSLAQPLHLPLAKFYRSILFVQSLRLPSFQVIFFAFTVSPAVLPVKEINFLVHTAFRYIDQVRWYTLPAPAVFQFSKIFCWHSLPAPAVLLAFRNQFCRSHCQRLPSFKLQKIFVGLTAFACRAPTHCLHLPFFTVKSTGKKNPTAQLAAQMRALTQHNRKNQIILIRLFLLFPK